MAQQANASDAQPRTLLSVPDGIFLMVGMVIGAGIFKAPSMVAGSTGSAAQFLGAWLLGGVISLCGALVYAELASRYPHTGGEYSFLYRGFGRGAAFLFAWSRMTVIQTGAIAAVAFVFGDYASEIFSLGDYSSAKWASISVVALTLLNLVGTVESKTLQKVMEAVLITSLVLLALFALFATPPAPGPTASAATQAASSTGADWITALRKFGFAMIFVLLTYGGWNEAAYISGEVRDARRNMTRILVWGIVAVTALYMLVNAGYMAALGLPGIAGSKAVAADVMRLIAGDKGATALALIVCVSAFTTINAAIFTGARTSYAFGQDFKAFAWLGHWRARGSTPANALVVQGLITLVLVAASSVTPDGFNAMVAYTSPVFWTFFLLTAATAFVFRARGGEEPAFRMPLYPVLPLAFIASCAFMLWSSIDYIRNPDFGPSFGNMVLAGLVIMALGIPLYWAARK